MLGSIGKAFFFFGLSLRDIVGKEVLQYKFSSCSVIRKFFCFFLLVYLGPYSKLYVGLMPVRGLFRFSGNKSINFCLFPVENVRE